MSNFTWKYAVGQLRSHLLRSSLTLFGTAFAVFSCVVVFAFAQGVMNLWKDGVFDTGTGHIHVLPLHNELFLKADPTLERFITDHPLVDELSPRLQIEALGISDYATTYTQAIGIDPIKEPLVSPRLFFPGYDEGHFVKNTHDAVIARGLVTMLRLKIGDSLSLVANTLDGSSNAIDLNVVGIIDIPLPGFSQHSVYLHVDRLKTLIRSKDLISRYTVRLGDSKAVNAVLKELQNNQTFRLIPWWESYPLVANIEKIWLFVAGLLCSLLALCAFMSVANIFMIMLHERRKEIATLRTLGIGFTRIQRLLMADAAVLAGAGIILGVSTAVVFLWIQNHYGVNFESPFGGGVMQIKPAIDAVSTLLITAIAIALCMGAILHAVRKSRRVNLSVLIKS
jgi:putative ABC transport system permease protein